MGENRRQGLSLMVAMSVAELLLVVIASLWLANEEVPGYCDENVLPGTSLADGCASLESGGYTVVRFFPPALLTAAAIVAWRRRRPLILHLGFICAVALLGLAIGLVPSSYPWADGTYR